MIRVTTKSATEMAKDLHCGIFWCLAETEEEIDKAHLLPFFKSCSLDGVPVDTDGLNAKSGMTFNHKATWATLPKGITKGHPFDYYPRGRVEVSNNKATIWMNGNLIELADEIKSMYGLSILGKVQVREDGSEHYKCHFDR
ncbi:MAG: hypothetical protein NC218_02075 [Acetobacter sp.]|nr:hypothetical protein [Acetobacter sp.]